MEYLPERLSDAGYMTAAVGCYDHAPDESPLGYQYRKLFLGDMEGCDYAKFLKEKHPEATGVYPHDDKGRFLYDEEDFYDRWSAGLCH